MDNMILLGDCLEKLKELPDAIADCCVTSPPYYGLRDYGTAKWTGGDPNCPHKGKPFAIRANINANWNGGNDVKNKKMYEPFKKVCPLCGAVREDKQIGLEESPEEYVQKLVAVFREVKRVLRDDGTLWLNISDSYAGSGKGRNGDGTANVALDCKQATSKGSIDGKLTKSGSGTAKPKDLIGIPWMLAFALRDDGWYLRQDIIWHKPNPMPESVKDRCTKSHEYLFLLSKQQKYYFDHEAIQEDAVTEPTIRDKNAEGYQADYAKGDRFSPGARVFGANGKRNKRDVWTIPVKPTREAHFATYPENLVKPCVLAGSRVGGVILDPFFGSGTTGRVAVKLNRSYIGIELNPKYVEIERRRTSNIQMTLEGLI